MMNISAVVMLILFIFLFFLFSVYITSFLRKKKAFPENADMPLSIVIPAYNEEKNIVGCLSSVIRSRYDKKLIEIIVVDDGSKDNTVKRIKGFSKKHGQDIRVITSLHLGKSAALNQGVKSAKNELVVCMDSDVTLSKDALANFVAPMQDKQVGAVNAVVLIDKADSAISFFQKIEYYFNTVIRVSFSRLFDNSIWFFGAAACYRKAALEHIGYFKQDTLTEDMDICLELYKSSYKILTVKDCQIYTKACKTIKALFNQRMRWYYGALQALVKNKILIRDNKKSIPVMFLFFNQFWWTFFAFVSFPIFAYQIYYWFPPLSAGLFEAFSYIFRWFSISGPIYVLYMIPEWGLSLLNIFGVLSGIITLLLSISSLVEYRAKASLGVLLVIFFYFPYTILLNLMVLSGVIKYSLAKKKYFV